MDFSELNSENQDLVQKRDLVIYNPSDLKAWYVSFDITSTDFPHLLVVIRDDRIPPNLPYPSPTLRGTASNCLRRRGLLDAAHAQDEGGAVSKYSPPQVISSTRKVFEELLDRFPVLPDVWIRYAEWEFKVTDSETTQVASATFLLIKGPLLNYIQVYEKGVAACPSSLALWMSYIEFQNLCIHDDTESRR